MCQEVTPWWEAAERSVVWGQIECRAGSDLVNRIELMVLPGELVRWKVLETQSWQEQQTDGELGD